MPTYPIRLDEELYQKLRERARKEGRSLGGLIRECARTTVGNPSVSDLLAIIHEDMAKFSCSSEINRTTLMAVIETLSHGSFDTKSFENELKIYDIMLLGTRYHGIKTFNELREFVRKVLKEEGEGK